MGFLENNTKSVPYISNIKGQAISVNNLTSMKEESIETEELEIDNVIDNNSETISFSSKPYNPNDNQSHSSSSSEVNSSSTIYENENQMDFPTIDGINIKIENYYYQNNNTVIFNDEYNNTYSVVNIDGQWLLESITNDNNEYISLLNEDISLIMNIFNNNNINITGISFSTKNNYIYIFTDSGNFLFDLRYCSLIYTSAGDDNLLEENGIYSDLAQLAKQYGGYQGFLDIFSDEYANDPLIRSIVEKYFPDETITEEQLQLLFSRMRITGCGYIGCINTVFDNFSYLTDEEWKNIFGFDRMQDDNYQYNYQYLFLDFFLYYQSQIEKFSTFEELLGNSSELYGRDDLALDDSLPIIEGANGMDTIYLINIMESYMKKYNINLNIEAVDCSNENFINNVNDLFNSGHQINITTENINVYYSYDYNYNLQVDDIYENNIGTHGFTLTGITDDGRWLVSSWGKELIIDPYEIKPGQYIEIFSFNYE